MKDYDEYDEQILSFDNLLKDLCAEGFKSEDSRKHFMDNSSNIAKMLGIKDEEQGGKQWLKITFANLTA